MAFRIIINHLIKVRNQYYKGNYLRLFPGVHYPIIIYTDRDDGGIIYPPFFLNKHFINYIQDYDIESIM